MMSRASSLLTNVVASCFATSVVVLSTSAAAAPAPDDSEPLDPGLAALLEQSVVSTASKQQESDSLAPATIVVVTADEMSAHGITSLEQAINYFGVGMSHGTIQGSPTGLGTLAVRGVAVPEDGGNHALILVNGHALNGVWDGGQGVDEGVGVPWEMVDHVELVLGPGAVLYGNNAMQAVLNVVTKDAEVWEGVHVVGQAGISPPVGEGGRLRGVGDGYSLGHRNRVAFGYAHPFTVRGKQAGITTAFEHYWMQGPSLDYQPQELLSDAGPRTQPEGSWGGVAELAQSGANGVVQLELGDFTIQTMGGVKIVRDPVAYNADFNDPNNATYFSNARLDIRHSRDLTKRVSLTSRAYADYVGYTGRWIYSDSETCDNEGRCDWVERGPSGWAGLEEQVHIDWFVDNRFTTLIGVNGRVRRASSLITTTTLDPSRTLSDLGRVGPDQVVLSEWRDTSAAGAVYLQQTIRPIWRIALNAGARLDLDQTLRRLNVSPRAAAVLSATRTTHFKLQFAQAFRAPGIGEVRFEEPSFWLPARRLDPETVRSVELSGKQVLPAGRGFVQLGGLYSWWTSLVGVDSVTQAEFDQGVSDGLLEAEDNIQDVVRYRNGGRIDAYGAFARVETNTKDRKLRFGGSVSLSRSAETVQGETLPVALAPDVVANARISYAIGGNWPRLGLASFYHSRRDSPEGASGQFVRPNRSPHHVQGRVTISGEIPRTFGLGYGVWADYTLARRGAYVVGQNTFSDDASFGGLLNPINRLTVMAGLRWDFSIRDARDRRRAKQAPTVAIARR